MRGLLILVVLIAIGIVGLGFYRGWFIFNSSSADGTTHFELDVNKNKIKSDEQKALEKVRGK